MGTAPCLALSGKLDSSLKKKRSKTIQKFFKKEVSKKKGGKYFFAAKVLFPTRGSSTNRLEAGALMPWCFLSDEL